MTDEQQSEHTPSEAELPGDIIHVTAGCGLGWTGPRHAWDVWFSDRHAWAHTKGRDGLSASCPGTAATLVEPGPDPAQQPKTEREAGTAGGRASVPRQDLADVMARPGDMSCQATPQAEPEAGS
jgi:hypothetical protein